MVNPPHSHSRTRRTLRRTAVGLAAPLIGVGAFAATNALADSVPPGNLTRNPSFETDPSVDWTPFHSTLTQVSLAPGEAPDGNFGVTVTGGSDANNLEGFSIDDRRPSGGINVPAGTQFVASAYMRAANPQSVGKLGKVWVRERLDGNLVDRVKTEVPLTTTFQKLTSPVYTVKNDGAEVDVYVAENPANPGDAFTADLVTLNRNLPPAGDFTFKPAGPAVGETVNFDSSALADPEGGAVTRAWDLNGDGKFDEGTGTTATTKFTAAGTYTVSLLATDAQGASHVFSHRILVTKNGTDSGVGGGVGTGTTSTLHILKFKVVRKKGVAYASFKITEAAKVAGVLTRRKAKSFDYAKLKNVRGKSFKAGTRQIRLGKLTAGQYRIRFTLRSNVTGGTLKVTKGFRIKH